jgi:large subunit ribosomal protein L15
MPLHRRLPKRGFTNIFKQEYTVVNLARLVQLETGDVTPEVLFERGILKKKDGLVKILGVGELGKALNVRAHKFSESAQEKITKAGGKFEVIA